MLLCHSITLALGKCWISKTGIRKSVNLLNLSWADGDSELREFLPCIMLWVRPNLEKWTVPSGSAGV